MSALNAEAVYIMVNTSKSALKRNVGQIQYVICICLKLGKIPVKHNVTALNVLLAYVKVMLHLFRIKVIVICPRNTRKSIINSRCQFTVIGKISVFALFAIVVHHLIGNSIINRLVDRNSQWLG